MRLVREFSRSVYRDGLWLLFLALGVRLATAALVHRPGYMDAAYYAAGAVNLAQGGGLDEPFLWHYLDDPGGLPHPGFLYWMPLPSLLGAPFAKMWPGSFFGLQLPFVLLSSLLPLVTYVLGRSIGGRRLAWSAGLVTVFSGFFFPYWTLPETFAPFALVGSLALGVAGWGGGRKEVALRPPFLGMWVGLLVGLAHMSRADGVLLLPIVAWGLIRFQLPHLRQPSHRRIAVRHLLTLFVGYALVMTPWFIRNVAAIGAPLSSAGTRTLWLRDYDDFYCYECALSLKTYLAWGWREIGRSKLWAMGVNLERFLAEDCLVYLFPFVVIGLYRLRSHPVFSLAGLYLGGVFLVHSLLFTFPGPRGGFFHAGSAAIPFLFVAGLVGVQAAVGWGARKRRWNRHQAEAVFTTAVVVAAIFLSLYAALQKLPVWQHTDRLYEAVGRWLEAYADDRAPVMLANPPAFWYYTHRSAVVVPNGNIDVLLRVAERYGVRYVLLDVNRPSALDGLYTGDVSHPQLRTVTTYDSTEGFARLLEFVELKDDGKLPVSSIVWYTKQQRIRVGVKGNHIWKVKSKLWWWMTTHCFGKD